MSAIVIISGASGVGKSGFNDLLVKDLGFRFSVSATTRALRPKEIDGVHYHALSQEEFVRRVIEGEFIEWAGVHHGDLYGTFREPLETAFAEGRRMLVEIDVEGRKRLMRNASPEMRAAIFTVFIKSPSRQELERRLRGRNDIVDEAKIAQRLAKADFEEAQAPEYDLVIVNDDLDLRRQELRDRIDERFGPWTEPLSLRRGAA